MKLEKLVGERFKERPADCVIDSHAIMVKGGYIKYMANGIYSSYLPLRRIVRKIEQILREEMDKIDGQEVQFPVVMPASLWDESGRYDSIGDELLRFTDRNNAKMVLGMTHEEAAVHLVREYAQSYTKYPFMIYQIQTFSISYGISGIRITSAPLAIPAYRVSQPTLWPITSTIKTLW